MARPTAYQTALLTQMLITAYGEEKEKSVTRLRISASTVRRLSNRINLHGSFLQEWIEEMGALGWSVVPVGDNFGVIRTSVIVDWTRISSRRISDTLERVIQDDPEVFDDVLRRLGADGQAVLADDD